MTAATYIPEEGLRFQIVGYYSNKALFAKDGHLGDFDIHREYDDQWWTLIPRGDGKYSIKSAYRRSYNKAIYSKWNECGLWDMHDGYDDQYFSIEFGKGDFEGYARLITLSTDTCLWAGDNSVQNIRASNSNDPQSYFAFYYEDMNVVDITYDTTQGSLTAKPDVTITSTVTNDGDTEVKLTADLVRTKSTTSSFSRSHGFSISVNTEITWNVIPTVLSGKVSTDYSTSHTWTVGEDKTDSQTIGTKIEVPVPKRSKVQVEGAVKSSIIDVPATITLESKTTKTRVKSYAMYRGTAFYDFTYSVRPAQGIGS